MDVHPSKNGINRYWSIAISISIPHIFSGSFQLRNAHGSDHKWPEPRHVFGTSPAGATRLNSGSKRGNCRWFHQRLGGGWIMIATWWLIPLSKWVITQVISGLTLLIPFITGVMISMVRNHYSLDWLGKILTGNHGLLTIKYRAFL